MRRNIRKQTLVVLVSLSFIGLFYASTLVTESHVEVITNKVGWFGPLFISLFILATQVFAPLSGTPGIFVGIKLYGFVTTLIVFYFTSLLSAIINFWLARTYGRKAVTRFVGKKTLSEIDELSKYNERALLITGRIFGYYFFDIISYAVGLTKIRFRRYFIYTAVLTLIPTTVQYLIFSRLNFNSFAGMLTYFISMAATAVVFARIFHKLYIHRRNIHAHLENQNLLSAGKPIAYDANNDRCVVGQNRSNVQQFKASSSVFHFSVTPPRRSGEQLDH